MANRYERTAYEAMWEVIQDIKHEMILKNSNRISLIMNRVDYPYNFSWGDFKNIINQFVQRKLIDFQISKPKDVKELLAFFLFLKSDKPNHTLTFDVNEKEFNKFADDIEKKYKGMATEYQNSQQPQEQPVYSIRYQSMGCKIFINDFLLANPNFSSENELIFEYVYNNPNKRISLDELKENCLGKGGKFKKTLQQIVDGLNFRGDLKEVFFNVSQKGILFRREVFRKDLDELHIKELNLCEKQ